MTQDNNYKEKEYVLSKKDLSSIKELMESRYKRWEWNYGQSPNFNVEKVKSFTEGNLELKFSVSNGIIKNLTLKSDFFEKNEISKIELFLKESPFREDVISALLASFDFEKYLPGLSVEDFIECLFY